MTTAVGGSGPGDGGSGGGGRAVDLAQRAEPEVAEGGRAVGVPVDGGVGPHGGDAVVRPGQAGDQAADRLGQLHAAVVQGHLGHLRTARRQVDGQRDDQRGADHDGGRQHRGAPRAGGDRLDAHGAEQAQRRDQLHPVVRVVEPADREPRQRGEQPGEGEQQPSLAAGRDQPGHGQDGEQAEVLAEGRQRVEEEARPVGERAVDDRVRLAPVADHGEPPVAEAERDRVREGEDGGHGDAGAEGGQVPIPCDDRRRGGRPARRRARRRGRRTRTAS